MSRPISKRVAVATIVAACVTYVAIVAFASANNADHGARGHRHGIESGGMQAPIARAIRELNLSAEQRRNMRMLIDQSEQQDIATLRTNRQNLATLADPNAPGYEAAVHWAKTNAADRVQRRSDLYTGIFALLTPEQRAKLSPAIADVEAELEKHIDQRSPRYVTALED